MYRTVILTAIVVGLIMPTGLVAQWEPDVRLTDDAFESVTSFNNAWCVACSGNTVHVVWHDDRGGDSQIYYKRSTDNGTTWGPDTDLTVDPAWSERPSITVCDTIVHVVWYDGRLGPPRIFYKRSLDSGTSWGPDVSLTPTAGVSYHPSVAVSDSIVHVAWTDMSAGPQIYYTRSLDNGTTWETDRLITPAAPPAGKNLASVAVSDSVVHVTWMDMRAAPQIYYTRSLDYGVTWETDRSISPVSSQFPSVAVSGSTVHVAYADFRLGASAPQIYYLRSLDDGTNWETEVMVSGDTASWYPSIAVSGSNVHVVWPDNRNGDPSEIYYRCSFDNGTNWGSEARLTDNPSESREPSVAVSDSAVHAVWHDNRDGNWEIYYKRNPTGNIGIAEQKKTYADNFHTLSVPTFFSDHVTMAFAHTAQGPLRVVLYDISGAAVFSEDYPSVPSLLTLENTRISGLSSGIYFLCIGVEGQTETRKLIKLD
jgi:hypothetical protein